MPDANRASDRYIPNYQVARAFSGYIPNRRNPRHRRDAFGQGNNGPRLAPSRPLIAKTDSRSSIKTCATFAGLPLETSFGNEENIPEERLNQRDRSGYSSILPRGKRAADRVATFAIIDQRPSPRFESFLRERLRNGDDVAWKKRRGWNSGLIGFPDA